MIRATYMWDPLVNRVLGEKTVAQRVDHYGEGAWERLGENARRSGDVVLLVLKEEKRLELYVGEKWVKGYQVLAASGGAGPKLREGDRQVPEGVYEVESLNPNSRFHLALRVGYPNARDREMGRREGRDKLGGDIMIHGKDVSVGCVAVGDEAIEELFVLVAERGRERVKVVIAPWDFG